VNLHLLARAARLLEARLDELERRSRDGDEAAWTAYAETARALAVKADR
jgi:hypothetical protein